LAVPEDSRTLNRCLLLLANEKEDSMTFDEAYEELRKLAEGDPFSLTYERASYYKDMVEIQAYIAPHHAPAASTYSGAVANMLVTLRKIDYSVVSSAPDDNSEKEA
jgi:hypothetical protein